MGVIPSSSFLPSSSSSVGKQSQLLLKPTEVELGLQVGVEFDNDQCFKNLDCYFGKNWEIAFKP